MITKLNTPTIITTKWENNKRDAKGKDFVQRQSFFISCYTVFLKVVMNLASSRVRGMGKMGDEGDEEDEGDEGDEGDEEDEEDEEDEGEIEFQIMDCSVLQSII
ncbi:hypothetical protein FDUTEX481_08077 [Tolypothrix sp. PCC 7601]|nr:hypothetical protein FDUTEX481_08077 [Tolypothrix sp. PCC 7601]